eukprot:63010-Prymnesium_polylepis.1
MPCRLWWQSCLVRWHTHIGVRTKAYAHTNDNSVTMTSLAPGGLINRGSGPAGAFLETCLKRPDPRMCPRRSPVSLRMLHAEP